MDAEIFVRDAHGDDRHPKMKALVDRAQSDLVRKRFNTPADLVAGLYADLVEYLERRELLRWGPFDAAPCTDATFDDLDHERMTAFIGTARRARQFPLADDAPPEALLEHLNLLNRGRLTNAAMLLFGKRPQRFLISSEVKCAHFHGTRVAKPLLAEATPALVLEGGNLLEKHESKPFNPDVAHAFFRAGLVEAWGPGVVRHLGATKGGRWRVLK